MTTPAPDNPSIATLTFLFANGGPRVEDLRSIASVLFGDGAKLTGMGALPEPIITGGSFVATIMAGGHELRMIGFDAPAPGLDEAIRTTRTKPELLAPLRTQNAHILCYYQGSETDPVEAMLIVFRLGAALIPHGLLGAIHGDAWQCFLPQAFQTMQDPAATSDFRAGAGVRFLCNRIPFHTERGIWWGTKGQHVFGVPDFALWDGTQIGVKIVDEVFVGLFNYIRQGAVVRPGETMACGGQQLTVHELTEYQEHLAGPMGTLALRLANDTSGEPGKLAKEEAGCMAIVMVTSIAGFATWRFSENQIIGIIGLVVAILTGLFFLLALALLIQKLRAKR